ncbi:uncharacterized protein [Clytia hemisphaerica]|uniref:Uncharacterized protein n=1 Tax=Clytia hemisphaerica TaxID=252671 RepID=A0A7M5UU71_9CNID
MEGTAQAYYQDHQKNQVEVVVVTSNQNDGEKSLKKTLKTFKVISLVLLLITISLISLTTFIFLRSGQPGCERQKLLSFSPTTSTTDLYSENGSFGSYDEEVLSKIRANVHSKLQYRAQKMSGTLLKAQSKTTAVPSSTPTSINRRVRRNPSTKMLCNTKSPSCLTQRKEIIAFSEAFDVELHYNGIHSKIIMLICRFDNRPASCESASRAPDTYRGNSDLPLKIDINNEEHIVVLHDYLNMTRQFSKSLKLMEQHFKSQAGQTEIADGLDVLLQRLSYLADKMANLEKSFISCGKCTNIQYKPTPQIMQFNSTQLRNQAKLIPTPKSVSLETVQSQYIVQVLSKFVEQMSQVFRRQQRCLI